MKYPLAFILIFLVLEAGTQTPALNVADSLFRSGNYDKALKQYDSLLAENPKLLLAKNELGKLLFKLSRFELAEKLFVELTIEDPNNPDNHHQLGLIEDEQLQYHKAKPHYLKSFGLDSTNLKNIVKLGEYFLRYKKNRFAYAVC